MADRNSKGNLLSLQKCKSEAEVMAKDPHAWLGNYRNLSPEAAEKIRHQGRRSLEAVLELERMRAKP